MIDSFEVGVSDLHLASLSTADQGQYEYDLIGYDSDDQGAHYWSLQEQDASDLALQNGHASGNLLHSISLTSKVSDAAKKMAAKGVKKT